MPDDRDFTQTIIDTDAELLSPSIRLPFYPLVVKTGKGAQIEDYHGKRYIDFLSMAAIMNTGYGHPRIVKAIQDQATELVHCNAAYAYHAPLTRLTQSLIEITPGDYRKKVAYGLSGGDANDGVIKLARAATGRQKILAFLRSYHGNTYGAMSLSAVSLPMRRGFGPLLPEIYHTPYPDCYRCPWGHTKDTCHLECVKHIELLLETQIPGDEIAAVIMEPIQGDAGIIEPPKEFVAGLIEILRRYGILLVAEEVQTGMGRTGKWFASEHIGITPDIIVLGKALGSGVPISAIVARAELMDSWESPGHVFCTGANPIACRAASETIAVIRDERLVDRAHDTGAYLGDRLRALADKYGVIGEVRGRGLMLGVDMVQDRKTRERDKATTAKVAWRCFEEGLLLTFFSGSVLRICPPLVITLDEVDRACDILDSAINDAVSGRVPDSVLEKVKGW
jgi:4-aminobutyrate aminotransferase